MLVEASRDSLKLELMNIENINTDNQILVVAEIGNNHEGDIELAKEMIRHAANAGAGAVKFQTIVPNRLVSESDTGRIDRLNKFQFSYAQFEELAEFSNQCGIHFFSTPFDLESARFLNRIQSIFKISSGDNNFYPLIEEVAEFGKDMIISTGLSELANLVKVNEIVTETWKRIGSNAELAFLHCVASYPVPYEQANLKRILWLKNQFPHATIGYSDHTLGIDACIHAACLGARIIEKHFTLDKHFSDFRDHQLSADPEELTNLVEKLTALDLALGIDAQSTQICESENIKQLRRSIAAGTDIAKGAVVRHEQLTWIRPGTGLPCGSENKVIGKQAVRDIAAGEILLLEDFESAEPAG